MNGGERRGLRSELWDAPKLEVRKNYGQWKAVVNKMGGRKNQESGFVEGKWKFSRMKGMVNVSNAARKIKTKNQPLS